MRWFLLIIVALCLGCNKQDSTPPEISLNGPQSISLFLGDTYTEYGAEAHDKKDGDLTSFIIKNGSVNTQLTGTYVISYEVADFAGNKADVKRYVFVNNHLSAMQGNYSVADTVNSSIPVNNGIFNYSSTIYFSTSTDNQIIIQNFGNKGSIVSVLASVSGNTITIPAQSPTGMPSAGQISGSGMVINNTTFRIQYFIDYTAQTGGPEDTAYATFVKQ